ncbi:MAG: asparagine synthase (glutamine-hydrolyzing) [Defluviitaleaceae bacterium]|nr:asparagine synthase (glutamine-hydrolyzing) [Defluviitaleaceae bacterium]
MLVNTVVFIENENDEPIESVFHHNIKSLLSMKNAVSTGVYKMNGICGYTGNDEKIIEKMAERIAHREPRGRVYNADGTLSVELDCEIKEETLLQLFEAHGEKMLDLISGSFAFLIYNHETGEIFAARDCFGIKPLYYGIFGGELVYASEIKAFLEYPNFVKEINHEALESYLSFQYSVLDETFFKGIFKLPAAHFLKYSNGELKIERYWQAMFSAENLPLEKIVDEIDESVKKSVQIQQESDSPIGSLLSGGVDSSYVAAVADKIEKTFTVGFDYAGFNEIEFAKNLSSEKNIENISKIISTDEYWDVLPKIQYFMDEPLADPAAVAQFFACKLAGEHVKCVLSGEGADELFGGYGIYREPLDLAPITRLPMFLRKFLGFLARKFPFKIKGRNYFIRASKTVEERFIGNAYIFNEEERTEILKNPSGITNSQITKPYYDKAKDLDDITKMQFLDIHLWLVGDILHNADRMAAANSLEMRVPFLDKDIFAIASKIPTKYRVNKRMGKFAFRIAAKRNFIDKREKKRMGFPVPTRHWLREEKYYNIVMDAFKQEFMAEFFNTDKLVTMLDRHKSGKEDNSRKIWTVYTFALWYGEFFE